MSPRRWWIIVGAFLLVLVAGLMWQTERSGRGVVSRQAARSDVGGERRDDRVVRSAQSESRSAGRRATGAPEVPRAEAAAVITTSVGVRARLVGAATSAAEGKLVTYIAAAEINPVDLAEQNARAARGNTGAGASDVLELANVLSWTSASIAADVPQPGDVIAASQLLPIAPVYEIAAYDYADDRIYHHRITHAQALQAQEPIAVEPVAATGLSIRLVNSEALGSAIQARIDRQPSRERANAESASALLHMIKLFKPELADALIEQDALLLATTATTILAPLPQDPSVGLMLATGTGIETGPLVFALEPGVIRNVEIDCAALFETRDIVGTTLRARVLLEPDDTPLSGAVVSRMKNEIPGEQHVTNNDGTVSFDGIPLSTPTEFLVETTASSAQGRALAPRTRFQFKPPTTTSLLSSATWKLRPYSWLVMELPDVKRTAGSSRVSIAGREYGFHWPVYLLQKRDRGDQPWKNDRVDQFTESDNTIAVSVSSPGEYRIGIAHNSDELSYTESASPGLGEEARVSFVRRPSSGRYSIYLRKPDGKMYDGPVAMAGLHSSLRPHKFMPANGSDGFKLPIPYQPFEAEFSVPGYAPLRAPIPSNMPPDAALTFDLK